MDARWLTLLALTCLTTSCGDGAGAATSTGDGDGLPAGSLDAGADGTEADGEGEPDGDAEDDEEDDGEDDGQSSTDGSDDSSSENCDPGLKVIVRDFTEEHPDFESYSQPLDGLVKEDLGADKKPVYAHPGGTVCTTGPDDFHDWYRDSERNRQVPVTLEFHEESPGVFVYDNSNFFPIDNQGLLNGPNTPAVVVGGIVIVPEQKADHNFLFTTEAHTLFTYHGGEVFTFRGDDDLWVFINDKLAVDIGGLHSALTETISLDDAASRLGIEVGGTYSMDIFHAERHRNESNYRIETTIDLSCIQNVPIL